MNKVLATVTIKRALTRQGFRVSSETESQLVLLWTRSATGVGDTHGGWMAGDPTLIWEPGKATYRIEMRHCPPHQNLHHVWYGSFNTLRDLAAVPRIIERLLDMRRSDLQLEKPPGELCPLTAPLVFLLAEENWPATQGDNEEEAQIGYIRVQCSGGWRCLFNQDNALWAFRSYRPNGDLFHYASGPLLTERASIVATWMLRMLRFWNLHPVEAAPAQQSETG